ncbi:MAG: chalcone isomerase family protein [Thiotrichales bacterium]
MSRLTMTLLLVAGLLLPLPASTHEGHFPPEMNVADGSLVLNGEGMRTRMFIGLYQAALYLKARQADATAIVQADAPMAIRLRIVSTLITSDKMESATREGFAKSIVGDDSALAARIEQFIDVFRAKIDADDTYDFVYQPGAGTSVSKNGVQITSIGGLDFKQALFGIWLGPDPAQRDLKDALLGKVE